MLNIGDSQAGIQSCIVHYDIELPLRPGAAALMAFDAAATGRFRVELHGGHGQDGTHHGGALLYVEVHPR